MSFVICGSSEANMSMSKYQILSRDMVSYLGKGVTNLGQFMRDLRSAYDQTQDEIKFIKDKLLPSSEQANAHIAKMIEITDSLRKDIDRELEQNVCSLNKKREEVRRLDMELRALNEKKRGNEADLQLAKNQVWQKRNDLQRAEDAMDTARAKLDAGKEERRKAQLARNIMLAIPFVGWFGAAVATIVDCTALKKAVHACQDVLNSASSEYDYSRTCVQRAENVVRNVKREIASVDYSRRNKERKVCNLNLIVAELKRYQKQFIELDEDVKIFFKVVGEFHVQIKVFASETKGGYSIDILQPQAIGVIKSLSKLMQRDIMKAICGTSDTKQIWQNLLAMEAIVWPAVFETSLI